MLGISLRTHNEDTPKGFTGLGIAVKKIKAVVTTWSAELLTVG